MGDIRILDPRFGADLKHHHRPWPSVYRNHPPPASRPPSFCYRPVPLDTLTQWMGPPMPNAHHDYNYVRNPNKSANDYYYLTPMYRNALPAPVQLPPSGMMMLDGHHHHQRPSRQRSTKSSGSTGGRHSVPPCTCSVGRTRSLEDVRSEMSEWEEYSDMNGNRVARGSPKSNGMNKINARRSMENLLEVEVEDKPPRCTRNDKPIRRRAGSYMVSGYLVKSVLFLLGNFSPFSDFAASGFLTRKCRFPFTERVVIKRWVILRLRNRS